MMLIHYQTNPKVLGCSIKGVIYPHINENEGLNITRPSAMLHNKQIYQEKHHQDTHDYIISSTICWFYVTFIGE